MLDVKKKDTVIQIYGQTVIPADELLSHPLFTLRLYSRVRYKRRYLSMNVYYIAKKRREYHGYHTHSKTPEDFSA